MKITIHDKIQNSDFVFFLGCNQPYLIHRLNRPVLMSVKAFARKRSQGQGFGKYTWRQSLFKAGKNTLLFLDAASFTCVSRQYGLLGHIPRKFYASIVNRFEGCDWFAGACCQDYMCEDFVLKTTGLSVEEHQRLTIHRYDLLRQDIKPSIYLMPVLQGYKPEEYLRHLDLWGNRLEAGMWVGIGSICKRNNDKEGQKQIAKIIDLILRERPDLLLHLFGVKEKALRIPEIRLRVRTADSGAFGLSSSKGDSEGRKTKKYQYSNNWEHQISKVERIESSPIQRQLFYMV